MTRKHYLAAFWLMTMLICNTVFTNCQSPAPKKPKAGASLEEQATFFIKSIVENDCETSADLMIPEFVATMGGKAEMIKTFKKEMAQYTANGTKLSGGKADNPTAYSKCNGTLQCVLRQEAFMQMGSEPIKMEANMLAISTDNGVTWKFLQAGGDDLATLRQKFPNLCEDLVLQKY